MITIVCKQTLDATMLIFNGFLASVIKFKELCFKKNFQYIFIKVIKRALSGVKTEQ